MRFYANETASIRKKTLYDHLALLYCQLKKSGVEIQLGKGRTKRHYPDSGVIVISGEDAHGHYYECPVSTTVALVADEEDGR